MMINRLGWIDFSPTHHNKVMAIMDMFRDEGVIDELGLGTIRDSISDILFPGTSTIQTRAKYFLLIPWIIQDIESRDRPDRYLSDLENEEVNFVKTLRINSPGRNSGVIGRTLPNANPRRKPSTIYWNGLRTYGILKFPGSLPEYVEYFKRHRQRQRVKAKGTDEDGNIPKDDRDADHLYQSQLWIALPKAPEGWKQNLKIELSKDEANFLKQRIALSQPESLWAFALRNVADEARSFVSIEEFLAVKNLPKSLEAIIRVAVDFNAIMLGALVRYNYLIQMNRQGGDVDEILAAWKTYLSEMKQFDWKRWSMDDLWHYCPLVKYPTRKFVSDWIDLVSASVFDEAKGDELLKARELVLKGIRRARLHDRSVAQKQNSWTGIRKRGANGVIYLTYRWNTAKTFLNDIQNGLTGNASTK